MQPLPHLRAAMVQLDAPVLIYKDERACLVEHGRRERDAKLHRRHGDPALAVRMQPVIALDGVPPRQETAALFQLRPDSGDTLSVFDWLAIVRHLTFAVEVALSDQVR